MILNTVLVNIVAVFFSLFQARIHISTEDNAFKHVLKASLVFFSSSISNIFIHNRKNVPVTEDEREIIKRRCKKGKKNSFSTS